MMRHTYDAIVYGATPSGIMCAIALARHGLTPLLIEPGSHLGGMVAGGLSRTDCGNVRTIGGITREFFERCGSKYAEPFPGKERWYFEPHIFEQCFADMLREANIELLLQQRLERVEKHGTAIAALVLENGSRLSASVMIDCTYEGDLMARAGVSYTVGRESSADYGESLAGVQPDNPTRTTPLSIRFLSEVCACLGGSSDDPHYVKTTSFVEARDALGQLLREVSPLPLARRGSGDGLTQAYNFRVTATRDKTNQVPFPRPLRYEPERYELLLRYIQRWPTIRFGRLVHFGRIAGNKFDLNNNGPFSTDYVGGNTAYPDADYTLRGQIWQDHLDYVQGFFWFLGHDERVPEQLRNEVNEWGLARDEFVNNGHWPHQLYVREARRMRGMHVLCQSDLQEHPHKPDTIAMGSFQIDSHPVQRIVTAAGEASNEGHIDMAVPPYGIPYRSIVPQAEECSNLLVPVCLSATHIACGSLRMEPVYMMLGHAAGIAASLCVRGQMTVQQLDVSQLQRQLLQEGQVLSLSVGAAHRPSR